jgi:hypothetical protein
MTAIREIVNRDIFKNFDIPKEFGDEFEMILVPTKDENLSYTNTQKNVENNLYMKYQEENGFSKTILAQESEDIWNDI